MRSDRSQRAWLYLTVAVALSANGLGLPARRASAKTSDPVLYLAGTDVNDPNFTPVSAETVCAESHLVIVTHGWYERQPWPAPIALAIRAHVDGQTWRCGWYDWRGPARRFLPADATKVGRDVAGPLLGRKILQLSKQWKHVHLIGHSAGAWVINEAARTLAAETSATIHLTFLDAYVPGGWDEKALGQIAPKPPGLCWAEHYFTRDLLNTTENVLTHAYNVDVTKVNPGFPGHKFPWHWYQATAAGRYTTAKRFAARPVFCRVDTIPFGFARSLEAGAENWRLSLTLKPENGPVQVRRASPK